MNVQFRASFAKDLKKISNKDSLKRLRETIERIERAENLQDIQGLASSRVVAAITESESASIASD